MKYHPVTSSNVKEVGWIPSPEGGTLGVRFHGGAEYHYAGVPSSEFTKVLAADADPAQSVGKHLHVHIKPRYKVRKVSGKVVD